VLLEYINHAMKHARYEALPDDGSWYGEIPPCQGVFANAHTETECRKQLAEVLEEWILFRIHRHLPVPKIDGLAIEIREVV